MIPETATRWIEQATGFGPETQFRLLVSLIAVLLIWLFRQIALRLVWRRTEDVRVRYQWKKVSAYLAFLAVFLVVGWVWLKGFTGFATYLGLLSAGLAIALRDPLVNLAAWVFILWRKPFEAGDRIEIGEHAGDVIDQRIFQFTLLEIGNWVAADQSTGRLIHVPNGQIFTHPLANYTHGFNFIWNEIPVMVTFESNWREAKRILVEIIEEHTATMGDVARDEIRKASQRFMIFYSTLTPTVYTSVADSGVVLTIRYLCLPRTRRGTEQAIWEQILHHFAERSDIDFAYPTRRFYDNTREGKVGLTPSSEPIGD